MKQNLTESEKKHVEAYHRRGMKYPYIAAEIVVGRYLMEFIHLQGEIEAYFEDLKKKDR